VQISDLTASVRAKHGSLEKLLASYGRVVVAYSGGVDSAFLARVAHDVLGERALALTARSASMMQVELEDARALAGTIGIAHRIIDTHELDRPEYAKNDPTRCYYCKDELFDAARLLAHDFDDATLVDGFNADDLFDHRPGHRAAAEHNVQHPLAEVGLAKSEIRALSKSLGLSTWNKPQLACLSSRLPYGMEVTPERLARVEAVEVGLRALGFFDVRARLVKDNDEVVRIEVGEGELELAVRAEVRGRIVQLARDAGFSFVTLDLEGFRSGRLNEGLVRLGRSNGRLT
jgi:pyridinium-3,5-biscarboxylic acid mononucleotide sulfurtransferase